MKEKKIISITLTIPAHEVECLPDDVRDFVLKGNLMYLLSDAIGEFRSRRLPARSYVERNYPEGEGYDWLDRDKKAQEVELRCRVAHALHNAALSASAKELCGERPRKVEPV